MVDTAIIAEYREKEQALRSQIDDIFKSIDDIKSGKESVDSRPRRERRARQVRRKVCNGPHTGNQHNLARVRKQDLPQGFNFGGHAYRCTCKQGIFFTAQDKRQAQYTFDCHVAEVSGLPKPLDPDSKPWWMILGDCLVMSGLAAICVPETKKSRFEHEFHDPELQKLAYTARRLAIKSSTITATGTANWNTNGAWIGGVQPTSADDVIIPSGAVISVASNTTALCRSLNVQAGASLTGGVTNPQINIGDASGGALTISSTATFSLSTTGQVNFISTSTNSGVGWSITTGGKTLPKVNINGLGGRFTLGDALHSDAFIVNGGYFDSASMAMTITTFNGSSSNVRTISLGTSSITCSTGGTSWTCNTVTNLTLIAASSTITLTGAGATFTGGITTSYGTLVIQGTGTAQLVSSNMTFVNLTRIGTASKLDLLQINVGGTIVTGILTFTGNTIQDNNRLRIESNTDGAQRTINCTGGSVVIGGDVDFQDIAITGSPSWTNAGSAYIGDVGGNGSLITANITPAGTFYYKSAASANWSTKTNWFTATNGGGSAGRVPLPQDTVFVDANSGANTKTIDMLRAGGSVNFTGFTGTITTNGSIAPQFNGSLTLSTGMSFSPINTVSVIGRGNHTLTSAGKSFTFFTMSGVGGTYTLQDALTASSSVTINSGTFTSNNVSIICNLLVAVSGLATTINLGTSVVTVTSTAVVTVISLNNTNTIFNNPNSTVVISTPTTNTRTIGAGAGRIFGTVTYTVANSPGLLLLSLSAIYGTINIGSGRSWSYSSTSTLTLASALNANGTNNGYLYLPGVAGNYVSTPDSAPLSITGDIDIRARISLDDWTPAGDMNVVSKQASGSQVSYALKIVAATGKLLFRVSSNGSVLLDATSTVAPTIVDGTTLWIRVTWRASDGRVQFFTCADQVGIPTGGSWTQLGTNLTLNAGGTIFDSTSVVELGSVTAGTANMMVGRYYYADIRNNILDDGTGIVGSADFTTKALGANSFVGGAGNTWTINGTLAQQGDGRITFTSGTPGSAATISTPSGAVINVSKMWIQDNIATGGAYFRDVDGAAISNVTGWNFPQNPTAKPLVKVGGVFVSKPRSVKVAGVFVAKPTKVKAGGVFHDVT